MQKVWSDDASQLKKVVGTYTVPFPDEKALSPPLGSNDSHGRCHAPNRFGTVNMEDNVNIKRSWCEGWAQRSLIVAIYRTRRLSWCKRWLPMSSSHHSHKNRQEAEETEGITSIMVWERNAIYCSPAPIPEQAKKLKNWWRNEGKKRRNDVSAQMSFLGA